MRRVREEEVEYPDDTYTLLDGDLFTGEVVEYEDGVAVELTTYHEGIAEGPRLSWNEDGQLISQGYMGRLIGAVGPWHEWDRDGNLIREIVFDEAGNIRLIREWDAHGNFSGEEKRKPYRIPRSVRTGDRGPLRWR
ncbi:MULTISPECIES: toxin-antitoxin system YwqK family antitoxin [unclassified Nocardiopsis]|uniref:toxin-antitoxin system YwqK family antitoxin n=1 Tax=unclassified Nocardiopsis TaxID=2649073 RepID=UPI000D71D6B2|nr:MULTISPECIES: hypothetical protein [unclassified Nocardiopsis]MBQ1080376.1 hypothetical protein [Nocardiopsis sp. B62]PWV51286.1 hypothetical protein BDW27_107359 [Nocardiopsis sp. L17-MgMaSL7]